MGTLFQKSNVGDGEGQREKVKSGVGQLPRPQLEDRKLRYTVASTDRKERGDRQEKKLLTRIGVGGGFDPPSP